jgi:hypothetical protein
MRDGRAPDSERSQEISAAVGRERLARAHDLRKLVVGKAEHGRGLALASGPSLPVKRWRQECKGVGAGQRRCCRRCCRQKEGARRHDGWEASPRAREGKQVRYNLIFASIERAKPSGLNLKLQGKNPEQVFPMAPCRSALGDTRRLVTGHDTEPATGHERARRQGEEAAAPIRPRGDPRDVACSNF